MTFQMIAPGAGRLNHMPEACRVRLTPGICLVTLPPEWNTVHGVTRSACDCVRRGLEFSRRGLINHKWRGRGGKVLREAKALLLLCLCETPLKEKKKRFKRCSSCFSLTSWSTRITRQVPRGGAVLPRGHAAWNAGTKWIQALLWRAVALPLHRSPPKLHINIAIQEHEPLRLKHNNNKKNKQLLLIVEKALDARSSLSLSQPAKAFRLIMRVKGPLFL